MRLWNICKYMSVTLRNVGDFSRFRHTGFWLAAWIYLFYFFLSHGLCGIFNLEDRWVSMWFLQGSHGVSSSALLGMACCINTQLHVAYMSLARGVTTTACTSKLPWEFFFHISKWHPGRCSVVKICRIMVSFLKTWWSGTRVTNLWLNKQFILQHWWPYRVLRTIWLPSYGFSLPVN